MNAALSKYIDEHIKQHTADDHCWRIRWRGVFIKTQSGKTAWETKGRAKSAFRNHLNYGNHAYFGIVVRDGLDRNIAHHLYCRERKKEFIEDIMNSPEVEYVEVNL